MQNALVHSGTGSMQTPLLVATHTHSRHGDGSIIQGGSENVISLATLIGWKSSKSSQVPRWTNQHHSPRFQMELGEGLPSLCLMELLDVTAIYPFYGISQLDRMRSICKSMWGERPQIFNSNHSWNQFCSCLSCGLAPKPIIPFWLNQNLSYVCYHL